MAAVDATDWAIEGTVSDARRDDGRPGRCATAGGASVGTMADGAGAGAAAGLACGLAFAATCVLSAVSFDRSRAAGLLVARGALAAALRTTLAVALVRAGSVVADGRKAGFGLGLATGLAAGLATGLATGLAAGLATGFVTRLATGLGLGLATVFFATLVAGLPLEARVIPFLAAAALATGLAASLAAGFATGLAAGLRVFGFALTCALGAGLAFPLLAFNS